MRNLFFKALLLIALIPLPVFSQDGNNNEGAIKRTTPPDSTLKDTSGTSETLSVTVPLADEEDTSKVNEKPLFEKEVVYSAKDSMRVNLPEKKIYLYGQAKVIYGDITLTSGYIELDMDQKLLFARGIKDSLGAETELPVFEEKGQSFTSSSLYYNFDTQKGLITDVITKEGEGYVHGGIVKKLGNDQLYISHGKYTTCINPEPHFYINAGKLKVIPEDKIITGPAYLVIEEVPTPLALPFGYFPNKKGRSSGILIPQYGESPQFGFYLRDGGYYFTISPYMDLSLRADIYSKGSWGAKAASNYRKRYKYGGAFDVRYSNFVTGYKELSTRTNSNEFRINWDHRLDPKARPGVSFTADVTAGSSNYNRLNTGTSAEFLNNSMQSNITWSKAFAGTPFVLSANASHSQNTLDSTVSLTIPGLTLSMARQYPFKSIGSPTKLKWLKKMGVNYTGNLQNTITTQDSLLFTEGSLDRFRNGMSNLIQVSTAINMNILTFTPNINYNPRFTLKTVERRFDPVEDVIVMDTINGFAVSQDFSLNAPFTTKLYATYQYAKGSKIEAIRHIMTPTFGFSYVPVLSQPDYFIDKNGSLAPSNKFDLNPVGAPNIVEKGLLTFALANSVEMKAKSKKDTITGIQKISILDNLSINTSYNLFAEEFQLSPVQISGQTNLLNFISLNLSAVVDPYQIDSIGERVNEFQFEQRGLGRLTNANFGMGVTLRSKRGRNKPLTSTSATEEELAMIASAPGNYVDFDIPWTISANYSANYTQFFSEEGLEKKIVQGIQVNGDVNMTPKWKVGFRSGYDFVAEEITYTSFKIYRDLHCWELSFDWVPFGDYRGYSVQINVKSSVLQDLKLSRKRYWNDFQTFN